MLGIKSGDAIIVDFIEPPNMQTASYSKSERRQHNRTAIWRGNQRVPKCKDMRTTHHQRSKLI